jgi:hypothetical protein
VEEKKLEQDCFRFADGTPRMLALCKASIVKVAVKRTVVAECR